MKKQSKSNTRKKGIVKFLLNHPNPKDERVHMWAIKHNYKVDDVEEAIYKIASKHVKEKK